MGERGKVSVDERPAPEELQARLAQAYLSGNGAEVERVLALIADASYTLPPKTSRAA